MSIKQKILLRVASMFAVATIVVIFIVSINFREYGVSSAQDKAKVIADLVKTGLTAHMVNGTMDSRDVFLDGIAKLKDVEELWVIRGENVEKQFGPPREMEKPRDGIDKQVLNSGEMVEIFEEGADSAKLRVTIPYNVTTKDSIKCVSCHQAKIGETLGAISMKFDISDIRGQGVNTVINILITTVIAIILVIVLTNSILNPYLELFEELKNSIKRASKGDFKGMINTPLTDEAGEMVATYDHFLDKLDKVFGEIDKKLRTFVTLNHKEEDPLHESTEIVGQLSELYNFKKAIELDIAKEDIYERLAGLLDERFAIKNFTISEMDLAGNESHVVYQKGNEFYCKKVIFSDSNKCRAKRVGKNVVSSDFPHLCPSFDCGDQEKEHICIPITVGGNIGFVINIVFDTKEESEEKKALIPFINNFANEAAPVLESKRLMQILKDSSLKDSLTGLYNRRFLDEYVETLAPQVIRQKSTIAILMIDMDYFKKVNDNYGHDVGDLVLKELSFILNDNIRDADLAVRYGGEEFIIILNNLDSKESAVTVAEKLRTKVEERIIKIGNEKTLKKTISIGLSYFPEDTSSIWEAIKYADVALYNAKSTGRNKVVTFSPELWDGENY